MAAAAISNALLLVDEQILLLALRVLELADKRLAFGGNLGELRVEKADKIGRVGDLAVSESS